MQAINFISKFDIGEIVFHRIEDNKKGIVLDISYSVREKQTTYNVVFGVSVNDNVWCDEFELSENPNFN